MSDVVTWALAHLPRQTGRTAVVTGANAGIGLETARGLAALGARVVLACRDRGRAEAAAVDLRSTVPGADLAVRALDLADLRSVAAFADGLGGDPLDLLVLNAGVMALRARRETAQGLERQFGVNVVGHFALAARLLDRLQRRPDARVVWLSSIAHRKGRLAFDDLQSEAAYDPWAAYRQSKLADLVLAIEMQRRLTEAGSDVLSVAAHPGVSITSLADHLLAGSRLKAGLARLVAPLVAMPAWRGALPTLVAATSPRTRPAEYVGPDGFQERRGDPATATIHPRAQDPEAGRRLWAACERLAGVAMLS